MKKKIPKKQYHKCPHKPHKPKPCPPTECPEGFFRYTVRPGDTIFFIARRLGVDQGLIIANNPLPDPSLIFPGQVLCVPIPISFPCTVELLPLPETPPTIRGEVLVERTVTGQHQATITARNLVPPSVFGDFDAYVGEVAIEGIGVFGVVLTEPQTNIQVGFITFPRPVLYAGAVVTVRPINTQTAVEGPPILQRDLSQCARPVDFIPPKG
ncbi:LysM peptidoglycan-binding domain-containing protein [Alkalicella caledoniensis]|uniref:LysM peptidoglycan-binding domain-containing protein n=1 Tax=Alkalicella caledoniensis TaxID=2731377 RepID=A0A7G9W5K8_ALKCA|nr:LysM domain-containing protein [Alkalicella caledoniensis]QNO13970.1 LysM peptidoglycan-binding domain-containing protein [Alkalicella caledoniensis]